MRAVLRGVTSRVAAALVALSVAMPMFVIASAVQSCCCDHAAKNCHCPVCEHGRELASGQRFLKCCSASEAALTPTPSLSFLVLPQAQAAVATPARLPAPEHAPAALILAPPREVPTPPPLA